jgi:PAS domain S-box-containing protein
MMTDQMAYHPALQPLEGDRCLADLEYLMSLSAAWEGKDPTAIVESVLEALLDRLQLDFVGLRFIDTVHVFTRTSPAFQSHDDQDAIFAALDPSNPHGCPDQPASVCIRGEKLAAVSLPLGKLASLGTLVAASRRVDFPQRTELLRLSSAAAQTSLCCREVRDLSARASPPDTRAEKPIGQELAESEWKLNLLINTIPAKAWSATPDGMLDFANQHFLDFIGQPFEAIGGLNFYRIFHPDDTEHLLSAWQEIMETKQTREVEGRIRRADGEYRWCALRQRPHLDIDGSVNKWYGVVLDIEERKRAEQALRETEAALQASERNLTLIIDSLPVLIWSARPDGSADFINKEWINYAGVPAEKILNWEANALYHPDDLTKMMEVWHHDLAHSDRSQLKARIRRADGEYRWFYFSGRKITDAKGIVRWFGVNVDIEDLQRAEDALRSSEAALRETERNLGLIINTVPAMAWSATPDGMLDFWNQNLTDFVGLPFEEIVGTGFYKIFHPDDVEPMRVAWEEILRSKRGMDVDARIRRADGEYRWFTLRQNALRDADGEVTRWYGIIIDIEDRRQAEEKLRQSQSDLARVARMTTMGELAVSIAHEVNQPLMAIVTSASTCLRWLDEAQLDLQLAREAAARIVRDGHRAGDIIAGIRALARKDAPQMETIALEDVVQDVLDLLKGELSRRKIMVRTEFMSPPIIVAGDPTQLQQVVLNLVMNSAEAMCSNTFGSKHLIVQTIKKENFGQVNILDNGTGVDIANSDRIFEAFFTSKPGGVGMGLSICRSIVEAHGGQIWSSDNSPVGSVFSFVLPLPSGSKTDAKRI